MPGIDRERFTGSACETFVCPICKDVVDDPVATSCSCEQIFCKSCIIQVFTHTANCPHCGSDTGRQTKPLQRQLKELYLKLRLKCSQPNCKAKLTLETFKAHDASCPLIPWTCERGCGLEGSIVSKEGHDCMVWLRNERTRLLQLLEEASVKVASLETQLTSELEERGILHSQIASMEALLDQVTCESASKTRLLEAELAKYNQRLTEAETLRDQLQLQIHDLKKQRDDALDQLDETTDSSTGSAATSRQDFLRELFPHIGRGERSGERGGEYSGGKGGECSRDKRSFSETEIESKIQRMSLNPSQTQVMGLGSGTNYGRQVSNQASGLHIRPSQPFKGRNSHRKEVVFLQGSTTDYQVREQVSAALRSADSKLLRGVGFSMRVKETMQSVHGGHWHCFTPQRFIPARVKYVESTFCLVKFDGAKYYIFRDQKN